MLCYRNSSNLPRSLTLYPYSCTCTSYNYMPLFIFIAPLLPVLLQLYVVLLYARPNAPLYYVAILCLFCYSSTTCGCMHYSFLACPRAVPVQVFSSTQRASGALDAVCVETSTARLACKRVPRIPWDPLRCKTDTH